jgi:hypothetical protein
LLHRRRAKGVSGSDQHLSTLASEVSGDLAQGGRLARAVHADEQHNIGSRTGQWLEPALAWDQFGGHGVGESQLHFLFAGLLAKSRLGEGCRDAGGRGGTQVGLDQHLFKPVELRLVERLSSHDRDHRLRNLFRGAR